MNILMPQLGETVSEGTIITWLKSEGDTVLADEILLEIETDKAATEVPAPIAGVLTRILVAAGHTVAVGTALAVIEAAPAPVTTATAAAGSPLAETPTTAWPPESAPADAARGRWNREPKFDRAGQPLSPAVRRLVREHALDPTAIVGGGRNGRIRRRDVLAHVAGAAPVAKAVAVPPTAAAGRLVPFSRLRKRIAEHMVRSKATSPHVLQAIEVDFSAVVSARAKYKAAFQDRHGVTLTFLPFVAHALCRALAEYPALNASIEGQALRLHDDVNLAVAVDLNFEGLVAPVLTRAHTLTLTALATGIHGITQRVRSGKFSADELKGGTYTLSNSGSFGTFLTAPIINQPQVAILSMDGIHKRATVIESDAGDSIAIRPIGVLAQSFDHRAVDGAYSAAYLSTLKGMIEARDWEAALHA
jgi:2-oxoglutarate dehydrogenase E2 component (dihydrolipoamide succinyltransferase)